MYFMVIKKKKNPFIKLNNGFYHYCKQLPAFSSKDFLFPLRAKLRRGRWTGTRPALSPGTSTPSTCKCNCLLILVIKWSNLQPKSYLLYWSLYLHAQSTVIIYSQLFLGSIFFCCTAPTEPFYQIIYRAHSPSYKSWKLTFCCPF